MKRCIQMSANDTVATAMEDMFPGDEAGIFSPEGILSSTIRVLETIPFGNKIALCDASSGALVIKYGAVIGECRCAVFTGTLIHVHNVKSLRADLPSAMRAAVMEQMGIRQDNERTA